MDSTLPELKDLFDFKYEGGGYFRKKGVPKNVPAPIIHGEEAIKYLYTKMKESLQKQHE
jgi:hypothetical protein